MKTIGLVFGGQSEEHEVSIKTTLSILCNINYSEYNVLPIYIDKTGVWNLSKELISSTPNSSFTFENLYSMLTIKNPNFFELKDQVDVFFPLVHGTFGEDGTLQGLFELLNVPYVGSGVLGSAVGMDKVIMKNIFDSCGIPQCSYLHFTKPKIKANLFHVIDEIETQLSYPCFIKPANAGSSIGITKAKNRYELIAGLDYALNYDSKVLIEVAFVGRELEIGILGNDIFTTSAVGEVVTTNDFYDYTAKYEDENVTSIQIPAIIPSEVANRMKVIANDVCKSLNCFGLSRVDFFWNQETDDLVVNEINTIPGFTPHSMYPMLFKEVGIEYAVLIDKLIKLAIEKQRVVAMNN